ncbi:PP2C family protein-serine/threonine phosphatase [Kitasatospora nipponensis]|uniref:PP2C family protein-serine/threonine phosphatase n=1 Tax=Kitasatospora nipponensis TaxID=258049 RepID=UPI0031E31438
MEGANGHGGLVYLTSADGRSLVLSVVAGLPPGVLGPFRRVAVSGPLQAALAYRSGRTVFVPGTEERMRRFPQDAIGLPYEFASASLPITGPGSATGSGGPSVPATGLLTGPGPAHTPAAGGPAGVLSVLWPSLDQELPPATRRYLRAAANRLSAALAELPEDAASAVDGDGGPVTVDLGTGECAPVRVELFDWWPPSGRLDGDRRLFSLLDLAPGEGGGRVGLLDAFFDAADRVALRAGQAVVRSVRIGDRGGVGGRSVEVHARGGADGVRVVGAVVDATGARAAGTAAERLREGVFALDGVGRVQYANRSAELLLGTGREQLLGHRPWEELPWLGEPAYEHSYRAAVFSRSPTAFLACRPPDHWLAFALYPGARGITGRVTAAASPGEHQAALREAPPAVAAGSGTTYHLLQLAGALAEAASVRDVCDAVSEQILPAFGGQEVALYQVQAGRMFLVAQRGYPEGFLDPFEATPVRARLPGAETLSTGAPIFFESAGELTAAYPGIARDEMGAWAFLPLIASGHPVGSCILGFDHPRPFTSEERAVLTALAGFIAQALERARLYDAEFEVARGLQQALLPHRLPEIAGLAIVARYLPGTQGMEIGGDWYDVVTTAEGLCLVIGDVEGHNVSAAALMGQLRSAVRAFVSVGGPLGQVMASTNRLLADLDPGLLASCLLLRFDPSGRRVEGVRAGHLPPLLRRPDGRTELLNLEGGPLLGVDPDARYPVSAVELPVGGVLALYTDGLVEEPGASLDAGIDRLRSTLAHSAFTAAAESAAAAAGTAGESAARASVTRALEAMADRVIAPAHLSPHRADDVALLLAARRH